MQIRYVTNSFLSYCSKYNHKIMQTYHVTQRKKTLENRVEKALITQPPIFEISTSASLSAMMVAHPSELALVTNCSFISRPMDQLLRTSLSIFSNSDFEVRLLVLNKFSPLVSKFSSLRSFFFSPTPAHLTCHFWLTTICFHIHV